MPLSPHSVLIAVDVQNDFLPGGALGVAGGDAVIPVINRLSAMFPHAVATQDWHPPGHHSFATSHEARSPFESVELHYGVQTLWPDHCVQGTEGAALHPGLDLGPVELIIRKGFRTHVDSYSAFFENDRVTSTGLAGYLRERGLTQVYLTGLATDVCVSYSALDAVRAGFEVAMVLDACRAIDVDGSLDRALAQVRAAGVALVDSSSLG
ncbi:MAG: bifunctional nicotinamidase/pyrazinamidase [Alsobacter sp.]